VIFLQKLLIADPSEPFACALAEALRGEFEIQICLDGNAALECLLSFRPDALVLNLMLPHKDGLTVLQTSVYVPPVVLGISSYVNAYIECAAVAAGVGYILNSPCINAVCIRLMDLICQTQNAQKQPNPQMETAVHLHILNFPTKRDGYQHLCACIPMFSQDPRQRLTKELYPAVAKACGCGDGRSVEHSIRLVIVAAWKERDDAVWRKYFPPDVNGNIPCPSNKEFIARLAELLQAQ